jgi:chromosome segregation ATPase
MEDVQGRLRAVETSVAKIDVRLEAVEADVVEIKSRLGAVEVAVAEIKAQLASISSLLSSVLPHLATKADINALKGEISDLRSEFYAREALQLKWLIGTLIASMALACTIAKLVR